jgi:7,8-dihydroneopterin aldolase/epimerase/oxygenase
MEGDAILIRGLELPVRIGVPETERAAWQVITAEVCVTVQTPFEKMSDELTATLDYEALANELKALAASRPRKLLETLAAEMIGAILRHEIVTGAEVELKKRILPGTDHVAVRMKRQRV